MSVAAVGDAVIGRPVADAERDAAFEAIAGVLRRASLAIANLEMNLLERDTAASARSSPGPRWAFGSAREAAELASVGLDVIGQANNHASDYGPKGMSETAGILAASGLVPVGAGQDLGQARAPVFIGAGARRIAVLAVAISSSPESIALPARGAVKGWPGINAIRYVADVTVDAQTFETLRGAAPALQGDGGTGRDRFTMSGSTIRRGTQTSVNLVPDAGDIEGILAEIARARAAAEVVVLSVHSHEPSNASDEPAELFRDFAHRAIEAGAALVVGHGPHRLRGIEVYRGGAILYSLGNFMYLPEEGQRPAADAYDGGMDMFSLAMGVRHAPAAGGPGSTPEWWDGALAVAVFDAGALQSLHVHPVDLGLDLPPARRGIPRRAASPRHAGILETLARLSRRYGTTVRVDDGVGTVEIGAVAGPR